MKMMAAIDSLEKERNQLRLRLDDSQRRADDAEARAGDAECQLDKREIQLQELLKEVEEKGDELNDVCVDNKKMKKVMEEMRAKLSGRDEENVALKREATDLRAEVEEMRNALGRLEEKAGRTRDQAKSLEGINDVLDAEKSRLTKELRGKSEEVVELERKILAQEEEAANSKAHYENLIQELKRTKRESVEHLEAERKKAECVNEEKKDMLAEIEGLKKTWEEKIARQKNDLHKLSKLVKKYKEQEGANKAELERKEETCQALRQTLEEERKSLKEYEKCYERLEKRMAETERTMTTFRNEAEEKDRQAQMKMTDDAKKLKERELEITNLRSKIGDLEKRLEDSHRNLGEMKSRADHNNDAFVQKDAERKQLEKLLKDAKGVLKSQSGTISELEAKIVEYDADLRKQKEALKEKDKREERDRLDEENQKNQLAQNEEKIKELKNEVEQKSHEMTLKEEEIKRLTEKCHEGQRATESLEKVVADQKREMWQRAAQMKQVDMELQEHRSDTDVTVRKLETALEQSLIDLKAKMEEVEKMGADLKAKDRLCREMKDAASRAEANSYVFKERVEELEKKFQEDRQIIDDLKGEKTALDLKLNLCQDQLTVKQNQLIASNRELQGFQDQVAHLEKRVDESLLDQRETINLKKENDALRLQLTEKSRETTAEVQKLSSLVESNSDQHLREMSILKESQEATLTQRDDVIAGLRRELDNHRQESEETNRQLTEAREMVAEMKRELRQRTVIVDEANEALTMKDCQIAKLEGKLASLARLDKMASSPYRLSANHGDAKRFHPVVVDSADRNGNNEQSTDFLQMASEVGVAPLRDATPPTRVRFDTYVESKERTPSPAKSSASPRTSSPRPSYSRPSYLTLSPPRFSPPAYLRGLSESPPIPSSLQPTPVVGSGALTSVPTSSTKPRNSTASAPAPHPPVFSPPPQSAASELDVRFKGVIQYLKDNGKCDDELEEISREMKDTLKRSMDGRKSPPRPSSSGPEGVGGWRQSINSSMASVAMEAEMESAERQLRDLEERLRANAAQRADIDSQLNGFLSRRKSR